MICDIDYTTDNVEIAWANSTYQYYSSTSDKNNSAVYLKKTLAYCVTKEAYKNQLLAGRLCKHNAQCYQRNCTYGVCRGRPSGESCS